ncbi:hypothetical protein H9P43_005966 [Blastocladiella emersonii ATCC 22665]|nr:hypothetical protein H9P43_005966 [Blastocladiella emersonii ATCC 22665]
MVSSRVDLAIRKFVIAVSTFTDPAAAAKLAEAQAERARRRESHASLVASIKRMSNGSLASAMLSAAAIEEADEDEEAAAVAVAKPAPGALMQEDERATGTVETGVIVAYIKAMGGVGTVLVIMLLLALNTGARLFTDLWLKDWTQDSYGLSTDTYLYVYFGGGIGQCFTALIFGTTFAFAGVRASRSLHREAVFSVLRSPMSYFDTHTLGQIVNRFSKDTESGDNTLPDAIRLLLIAIGGTLSTLGLMISATPIFAAPLVPLLVVYWFIQLLYRATSREIKRLDSITRSPLFSLFSSSLSGLSTIRAYREETRFLTASRDLIDLNNRPFWMLQCASRWLSIRLESIGACLVLASGVFSVMAAANGSTSVATLSLSLSYSLSVTGVLNLMVRQVAQTEVELNSVERVSEIAYRIPQEPPLVTDVRPPSASWPEHGEIEFKNVTMAYREGLDPVLKDVSFTIPAGSKLAIVGRTGSGKSTTLIALFRLVELMEGSIIIDGVDIAKIGLHDLRKRMKIIPQEPVLFSGTIRSNIDREGSADDEQIWACLKSAGLYDYVQTLPEKLDAPISTGGENLSVGQRQLLCLARAMVHRANVLVMDEATASVHVEGDRLIQTAIRRDFVHATVITIAHRLNTIIDYDYVLVLDHGRVAELASPAELLSRPESLFTALVDETGPANAALLRRLAVEKKLDLDLEL